MLRPLIPIIVALAAAPPALAQGTPASQGPVASLDHVAILVADQKKSVDFYQGIFGLQEIASPFPPGGPRWLALGNGAELHIQAGRTEPVGAPWRVHFAISVASLDPVMAYLTAHALRWYDSAQRPGQVSRNRTDGVQQIFFQDPDGYWIEVNDALAHH